MNRSKGDKQNGLGRPDCEQPANLSDVAEERRRPLVGLLCIAVGIFIFCINRARFAAGWIQPVVAGMFALAGVQFIAAIKGKVAAVIGGLIYLGFSALGFYAAFGPGSIHGGIPFFPEAWNQKLGRTLFGGVGCLTALLAVYVFRQAWKPSGKHQSTA